MPRNLAHPKTLLPDEQYSRADLEYHGIWRYLERFWNSGELEATQVGQTLYYRGADIIALGRRVTKRGKRNREG